MKKLVLALVYTAVALGANATAGLAADGAFDRAAIDPLRDGDMKKLIVLETPRAVPETVFERADGAGEGRLSDYRGKTVLLNFWATWCAPCRKEMPHLAALQTALGGDGFEVLTIATGRNSPEGIARFFDEIGVDNLPRHQDPKQALARDMGVIGLPITVLIDRDGNEIARLIGDADWNSDSARAIIAKAMD